MFADPNAILACELSMDMLADVVVEPNGTQTQYATATTARNDREHQRDHYYLMPTKEEGSRDSLL
jgi:hypothetical protein